ncbi:cupin domain-containing protein [Pseudoxanthobacter sp. M-2]
MTNKATAAAPHADHGGEKPVRIGVQLRHARLVKGLRLKDVADRAGYSESLISKIENNKAMPSINTLHRIARVLDTSMAALLSDGGGAANVVMTPDQRPRIIADDVPGTSDSDGTEAEVMIPFGASTMLEAFLVRVQPGGSSGGERHHDGEEVGFVRCGELVLTVNGEIHHLKAGDSFFFPSTQPHSFSNPGAVPTEIVWINTPPSL